MPKAKFIIEGDIKDFTRVDNLYRKLKSEGSQLLDNWRIEFDVQYEESMGEIEE